MSDLSLIKMFLYEAGVKEWDDLVELEEKTLEILEAEEDRPSDD